MRTAPGPNAVPLPGMCPSVAVLAGGGDGGGGSGKSGKTGDGSASGSGSGNGDGAGDDGKGAGTGDKCGPGAPGGSCPTHQASASKGDPVDVATGNVYTLPATDVWFRGPLNLVFTRRYRSELRRKEDGLGFGWTHNLSWRVEPRRPSRGAGIRVVSGTGTAAEFPDLDQGEQAIGKLGWQLRKEANGYSLLTKDEMLRHFEHCHDDVWRLTKVTFRGAHQIKLTWDQGKLMEAMDPAGRRVRFSYDNDGRMTALSGLGVTRAGPSQTWRPLAAYTYSPAGDLIAAADSEGNETAYAYDELHRLVRTTDGAKSSTFYVYDDQDRCVETWVAGPVSEGPPLPDPALADDQPALLADGVTPAKGFLHCVFTYGGDGYVEVTDSRATQRYFGEPDGSIGKSVTDGAVVTRVFDDLGYELARTDPLGGTVNFERDERGNILAWTDPLGRRREMTRDDAGRIVAESDALGGMVIERDLYGNMTRLVDFDESITAFKWEGGLMREVTHTSGYRTRYTYDTTGDVSEILGPDGARYAFQYDDLGRLTGVYFPNGTEERYAYNVYGDLLYMRDPTGAEWRYTYDGAHELVALEYPDGQRATVARGAFHLPYLVTRPGGTTIGFKYDREARPRWVENSIGQRHTFERSPEGFILEERTFDGRTISYKYDAGRRVVVERHGREQTKMTYDKAGNLLECEYPDGSMAAYTYDERDLLLTAINDKVKVSFERDRSGRVVREVQDFAGETNAVETSYDDWGTRAQRRTSRGHTLDFVREGAGGAKSVVLDGALEVAVTHNSYGYVSSFSFKAGGTLAFHYDDAGRMVGEEQLGPRAPQGKAAALPDFPGVPPSSSLVRAWRYSRRGDLTMDWDRDTGLRYLETDPLGQVVSRTDEKRNAETYRYDAAGNVLDLDGVNMRYEERAARPTHTGDTALEWDDLGRLVKKTTPGGDGWRYEWTPRSELARAKSNGHRVDFVYDAIGRRIARQTYDKDRLVETTRFVWDEGTIVHEITDQLANGSKHRDELTYWSDPDNALPVAEKDASGTWRFALNDSSGAPHRFVDTAGGTVGRMELGVFGQRRGAAPSSTRFPGQSEDQATGLYYNMFRYYDPNQGRYISPDPLGIEAGLNLYRYAENIPTTFADPDGLAGATVGYLVLNDGSVIPAGGKMMPSGMPGSQAEGMYIPRNTARVQNAIPQNPANKPGYPPGVCVEAHLMSELQKAGKRPEDIAPGGMVILDGKTGKIKPPCNYCKPMLKALGVKPNQIRKNPRKKK